MLGHSKAKKTIKMGEIMGTIRNELHVIFIYIQFSKFSFIDDF